MPDAPPAPEHFAMTESESIHRLGLAARHGNASMLRMWLSQGANPKARHTALDPSHLIAAMAEDHFECVKLLIPVSDLEAQTGQTTPNLLGLPATMSALHLAAGLGDLDYIQMLVQAGADPNAADPKGVSPLMCSAAKGHLESCRLLIDSGADASALDAKGFDAAAYAEKFHHSQLRAFIRAYQASAHEQSELSSILEAAPALGEAPARPRRRAL
jgi:ankyrin repeat protein